MKKILCFIDQLRCYERCHSESFTSDDGAEAFFRVGHESLDLLHGARDAGQQLHASCCHCYVILNANLHTVVTE